MFWNIYEITFYNGCHYCLYYVEIIKYIKYLKGYNSFAKKN